nr:hypothetical protein Itr_chr01CG22950 [Ipomoea trifida]
MKGSRKNEKKLQPLLSSVAVGASATVDWAAETERALSRCGRGKEGDEWWGIRRKGAVLGMGLKRESDGRAVSLRDLKVDDVKQYCNAMAKG